MTNITYHRQTNINKKTEEAQTTDARCGCINDEVIPSLHLSLTTSSLIVTSLCLLCFWNAQYATFTFDDNSAILSNKDIRSDETPLWKIFENDFWGTNIRSNLSHKSYRPLTVLTYRWNYFLSGGYHPWGFHLVNIFLHILNSVLLLRVFSILFTAGGLIVGDNGQTKFTAPKASLLAASLFAVHPIHTESVVAVVGRADLICCALFISSFLCYVEHCNPGSNLSSARISMYLLLSLLCGTLAMFSKEQGITVLGICLSYEMLMVLQINASIIAKCLKKEVISLQTDVTASMKRILVVFTTLLALLLVRLSIMGNAPPKFQYHDNPASFQESLSIRVVNYLYLYSINIWLLLSPWWLCFDWAMGCVPVITSFNDPRLFAPLFMLIMLTLFLWKVILYLDGHVERFLAMSFCLMVIPFVPAMNIFFRVGFVIAERNLYISSIGYVMIITFGVAVISSHPLGKKMMKLFIPTLIIISILRSINRTNDWLTEYNLFISGSKVCPLNAKVHYNIGKMKQDSGNTEGAVEAYKESIRLARDYDQPMNNLGNILKEQKKLDEAEYYLEMAVKASPFFATGWMNLAIVKAEMKKKAEANRCYAEATRHRRNYPDAFYNWGNLHLDYNERGLALEKFNRAIELKPNHLLAWQNKIILLGNSGVAELMKVAKQGTEMFPDDDNLFYLIGNSFGKQSKFTEAAEFLHGSININPRNANALGALGVVYHSLKDFKKAEKYYKESLRLNPQDTGTMKNFQKLQNAMKA